MIDTLRWVAVLAATLTGGVAVVVVIVYATTYLTYLRARRTHDVARWRGLLPAHVALIGTSYLLLLAGTVIELLTDDRHTWQPPVYAAANVLGAVAMWVILGTSLHRRHTITTTGGPR